MVDRLVDGGSGLVADGEAAEEGERSQLVLGEPLAKYLALDESAHQNPDWEFAALRVMIPHFSPKEHQKALWDGLAAGTLQVTAADHCAFRLEQNKIGKDNLTEIPNGTGGMQERAATCRARPWRQCSKHKRRGKS